MNWLEEYIYLDKIDINRHRPYHYTRQNLAIQKDMMSGFTLGSVAFVDNQLCSYLRGFKQCGITFLKETALYIMGQE